MQLYISIAQAFGDTIYFATAVITASYTWKSRKDKQERVLRARRNHRNKYRQHRR